MDFRRFKFALPATLAVSTFVSASACRDEHHVHCVDIEKKKRCEAESACYWDSQAGLCESLCETLEQRDACEAVDGCFWAAWGSSETGGEEPSGSCHEPFT